MEGRGKIDRDIWGYRSSLRTRSYTYLKHPLQFLTLYSYRLWWFKITMGCCSASRYIYYSSDFTWVSCVVSPQRAGLFKSLWEAARSLMMLTWSAALQRKSLGCLMDSNVKEEMKRREEAGKKLMEKGERRGGCRKKKRWGKRKEMAIRGMTEQIQERQRRCVSILHPQWELRPAGWVVFLPPSSFIMFIQQLNVALCSREKSLHPAQVASVGWPYSDKQLAQHRQRHTRFCLSYTALDLGRHTHSKTIDCI